MKFIFNRLVDVVALAIPVGLVFLMLVYWG